MHILIVPCKSLAIIQLKQELGIGTLFFFTELQCNFRQVTVFSQTFPFANLLQLCMLY